MPSAPLPRPTAPAGSSFLVLHVNGHSRALPIRHVNEIAQADAVTNLPRSAGWIRGALTLRGSRVPVVDLAVRLGEAPTPLSDSSCVVIAEVATAARSVRVGLLADEESRVTSARLPSWAVLSVDELLDLEELSEASAAASETQRSPSWPPAGEGAGRPRPVPASAQHATEPAWFDYPAAKQAGDGAA